MVAEMSQATEQTSSHVVQGLKLSSVVPAKISGDNQTRDLTGLDLAVKLHYIRGVYFFRDVAPLGIEAIKEPMFRCLEVYYPVAGRIRRADTEDGGRPFLKCNDTGVRIVEASSDKTLDEWLSTDQVDRAEIDDRFLIYDHVLGPDLGFTPLVFIQFTWFKCGGISVGLSWAHVLGDALSASSFINAWAHIMSGHVPHKSFRDVPTPTHVSEKPSELVIGSDMASASSLRKVDPVGVHWIPPNHGKMRTFSLHITNHRLDRLLPTTSNMKPSKFHFISALIWKSLCKTRGETELKNVTICTSGNREEVDHSHLPRNRMVVSMVEADYSVPEIDVSELAKRMEEQKNIENRNIEETLNRDGGASDYILYGAKLTFVNLEDADIYGIEIKGRRAMYANYTINGVGDEGMIVVLPWRGDVEGKEMVGRRVTATLPANEAMELKDELIKTWGFV